MLKGFPEWLWFVMAFTAGMVWVVIGQPIVARFLGIHLAWDLRHRGATLRQLTKAQYIWLNGVFGYATAMFIATSITRYSDWISQRNSWQRPSVGYFVISAVVWGGCGALFGWWKWEPEGSAHAK